MTNTVLNWTAGSGAASHDVYFGAGEPPAFQGNQPGTSFDPGGLADGTTYYWRIDELNEAGTTTGSTWSFTTAEPLPQDIPVHVANLEASSIPGARGRWTAVVTIRVEDDAGLPVAGVLAEGSWIAGTNGGTSCTTGAGGECAVSKGNLKADVASVTFALNSLSGSGMTYDSAANEVDTTLVVPQEAGGGDLLPTARNDSFTTAEDTPVGGNVMGNDELGDEPTAATPFSTSTPEGSTATLESDGVFTYVPASGFTGTDSFDYTITDSDGDSDAATITVTVDPVGGTGLELTATPVRIRGVWNARLNWTGGTGTGEVTISRDGTAVVGSPAPNDGEFLDEIGKKPLPSYDYEVCELDSTECAVATVTF
jgi:hypothetical protein